MQRQLLLATGGRVSLTEQRVAREALGQEIEKYWPLLVKTWPAYERFFAETHERAIFVLQRPSPGA